MNTKQLLLVIIGGLGLFAVLHISDARTMPIAVKHTAVTLPETITVPAPVSSTPTPHKATKHAAPVPVHIASVPKALESKPSQQVPVPTRSAPTSTITNTTIRAITNTNIRTISGAPWKRRSDGAYTLSQAIEDYNASVNGWAPSRMSIVQGKLRTLLEKNTVGPEGGLVSWIDVSDKDAYELQFDVMFDKDFDFSQGGKVGYGLLIGNGNTGGDSGADGNGASVRLMWYRNTPTSPVVFRPYVYHKDQPGQYGDDFGKTYPVETGKWYTVKIYAKSNTGSNTDGHVIMTINGTTLLDKDIRFTTNDAKRLINRVTFETFRGGADASWTSATDGYIYFDNVVWR